MSDVVRGACEILGLDPLYVANERRFVAFVPERDAVRALDALRSREISTDAVQIGSMREHQAGLVTLQSCIEGNRVLDMLSAEQLSRICRASFPYPEFKMHGRLCFPPRSLHKESLQRSMPVKMEIPAYRSDKRHWEKSILGAQIVLWISGFATELHVEIKKVA